MTVPFNQGREAARAGQPHTDCPIQKPEAPAQGEYYPGDWANWMQGWATQRGIMGQDATEARQELTDFITLRLHR